MDEAACLVGAKAAAEARREARTANFMVLVVGIELRGSMIVSSVNLAAEVEVDDVCPS